MILSISAYQCFSLLEPLSKWGKCDRYKSATPVPVAPADDQDKTPRWWKHFPSHGHGRARAEPRTDPCCLYNIEGWLQAACDWRHGKAWSGHLTQLTLKTSRGGGSPPRKWANALHRTCKCDVAARKCCVSSIKTQSQRSALQMSRAVALVHIHW